MSMYYLAAGLAICITMALGLARALLGPNVFDRILAVNMFGTKAVLLVALFAFYSGRHDLLDISLLYSLLNFVGVIAALRLVERGKFFANEDEQAKKKLIEESNNKSDSGDKNA
ncbi:monovalent cation/H+ antiporter complex subunit F [Glaciecola sp. KUL10]|uniref:monovalent cation/H+ antiporter complex subunit F n=1 Tax=Glaciecola sp. (strain KUL10) TaxID=2161813 RepID=UPI000D823799|nr:monovalent cation/H+ antiporter complex subunit F [Glaciecola sp. KUL10]GBL05869.1 multiple resistance and pH regulation protein F [Glaciecola sp. KUL10]